MLYPQAGLLARDNPQSPSHRSLGSGSMIKGKKSPSQRRVRVGIGTIVPSPTSLRCDQSATGYASHLQAQANIVGVKNKSSKDKTAD
jgi:hypothetical protein